MQPMSMYVPDANAPNVNVCMWPDVNAANVNVVNNYVNVVNVNAANVDVNAGNVNVANVNVVQSMSMQPMSM